MQFATEANPEYQVFSGINLAVNAGERVAIVGRNGSGKSTLLRIMARIFAPTSGRVEWARGTSVSLLSLGLGFSPHLSGRDNAFLSCLLMGLTRKEAQDSLDGIQAFCELGDFFEEPVHTYSSGMRARLGFATALLNRSQVILIDEVLSVGDRSFRENARNALEHELSDDRAVVLVSHVEEQVRRLCHRAILLEQGVVAADGPCSDVLARYAQPSL